MIVWVEGLCEGKQGEQLPALIAECGNCHDAVGFDVAVGQGCPFFHIQCRTCGFTHCLKDGAPTL